MVVGFDAARQMRPQEAGAVDTLLQAAFGQPQEALLVRRLRTDGDMVAEFVSGNAGVQAYAGISRMAAPAGWLCLAPVAVDPALQGQGTGSRLVALIVEALRGGILSYGNERSMVVLGKPSFYARAGFSRERAARLVTPYPVEYTLIDRPGDDVPEATLVYPPAFAAL